MKTLEFSVLYRSISLCNMYVFAAERKVAITLFSTYYICVVYYRYDRIIYLFICVRVLTVYNGITIFVHQLT